MILWEWINELLRALGSGGRHLDELGVGFPVIEAHCRYRRPARYDDLRSSVEVTHD